ncbi:MAG: AMP-binding protein [Dethiobacteria bacterium]|jgi:non-ribosomal peptide synthetase component E (peptide arylation enzyme)
MALNLEGAHAWPEDLANYYREKKWWLGLTWGDILDRNADMYGSRTAIIDDETSLTWEQFRDKVDRLAWALLELGVKKNDTIVVQVKNNHEYLVSLMAICRIGAVELQALTNHGEREISHFINMTDAVAWIVSLDDKKKDLRSLVSEVKPKFNSLRNVICIGDNIPDGCEDFNKMIAEANPPKNRDFWTSIRPDPNHVYLIGLTGGTTGLSKGVPRTYNDHILDGYYWGKSQQLTSEDVGLVLTPAGHNLAHVCVMFPMLLEAGTIVIANIPNPDRTMEIIQNTKSTFLWCVPTQLSRMLDSPNFDKYDLSSLRFVGSGGAHVPAELIRGLNKRVGCDFVNGFGMIEGPCTCTRLWDTFEAKCNTIGTATCPYVEFKIIDPVTEVELPRGKEGEMVAKGPHVFQGYYKTSREGIYTKDGFFRSGDLAKMDEEGRISITGRIKDVINRGGEMISAREIEEIMMTHARVAEAAVIAMPCPDMGERVCLYVRTKEGAADLTLEEVQKHCEEAGLAKFQWPERVENLSELPLTNVGKPDKKKMREMISNILKEEGVI